MTGTLTLVHLSDIHFRYKRVGTRFDLYEEVRVELENDLLKQTKILGGADGILVSGDIAFGGKAEEYNFARRWLNSLTSLIGCNSLSVWCIPGNHDVDRETQKKYVQLPAMHEYLRGAGGMLDERLRVYLEDESNGAALLKQFDNYNEFAKDYRCATTREDPKWQDELPITPNVALKIRGINSAIICSDSDGYEPRHQLVVGEAQAMHLRRKHEVRLTMCHHPPAWLADENSFEDHLRAPGKVPIQLFGHEHRFQIEATDEFIRLYAGAFQPDRSERDWLPRYNLLQIEVDDEAGKLLVRVFPRTWTKNRDFDCDRNVCAGKDSFEWKTLIEPSSMASAPEHGPDAAGLPVSNVKAVESMASVGEVRRLAYAFFNLPFTDAIQIAADLDLLKEEDRGVGELERRRRLFDRAQSTHKLGLLWEKVRLVDHRLSSDNPFSG